jgi:protease-4
MKKFFRLLLANFVANLILLILFIVLVFIIAGSVLSSSEEPVKIDSGSVLKITLNKAIQDRSNDNPLSHLKLSSLSSDNPLGLDKILAYIGKAATDENIKGIYLEITDVAAGWATVDEIRQALLKFHKSGKFIIAYSDLYSQKAYFLASAADKVYLNPQGEMMFTGLSSERLFYKGAFEKLGIEPVIIRHGKFKSYVEPYVLDKMSDENRLQTMTYLNGIWKYVLGGIAEQRKTTVDALNKLADELTIRNAKAAADNKLVDSLLYKDQVLDLLAKNSGAADNKPKFVSLERYMETAAPRNSEGLAKDKIAVVYFTGTVNVGESDEDNIGSERFCRALRDAREDKSIKAVVIRVNSGGGSALASEEIWREVTLTRKVKPVIASFGDVAASGGYYLAVGADAIVASPVTITGSIGVFGMLYNAQKFMNQKLGITYDVAKTNPFADLGMPTRPVTAQEKAIMQNAVEEMYSTFTERVAEGRKLRKTYVDSIGQGRVWVGSNALELKLIDAYAGLDSAVRIAASKANLKEYRTVALPKLKDPIEALSNKLSGKPSEKALEQALGEWYTTFKFIRESYKQSGVYARLPFEVNIR